MVGVIGSGKSESGMMMSASRVVADTYSCHFWAPDNQDVTRTHPGSRPGSLPTRVFVFPLSQRWLDQLSDAVVLILVSSPGEFDVG